MGPQDDVSPVFYRVTLHLLQSFRGQESGAELTNLPQGEVMTNHGHYPLTV